MFVRRIARSLRAQDARALVVGTLLVALATIAVGARAEAAEKAIWGPAELPDGSSAFPLYEELGVDTLQLSIAWSAVAPRRPAAPRDPADPAYRWPAEVDAAVAGAARHGVRIALLVTTTPGWANGGASALTAPRKPGDFASFVTAAGRRYPAIRRWMIWGEPNKANRFQPNRLDDRVGPRAYAPLLDAAYAALKAADTRNIVIGGMTWTGGTVKPPDFVRWMRMPDGRRPRLDWFGHNPFPFRFPRLAEPPAPGGFRDISDLDTLSREILRAYGRRVPLWLSEYTIQSDHGSDEFASFVSRAGQARYLSAGLRIADDLGDWVAGIGWLSLLDPPPADNSANFGLLTNALERKPAFAALARAPGERHSPLVKVASTTTRRTLSGRGLAVTITPRASGSLTVQLRRGATVRTSIRVARPRPPRTTVRLRSSSGRGRYAIWVRSERGATVRRSLRVR